MKLSIGIVGLPNVGKSTLFKALTKIEVNIANYPFATIDPNIGIVTVPDERLDKLTIMSKSQKKIPAVVEFYDIAGLVKDAYKGEGLGNQFLNQIRETNAIIQVLRCFPSDEILHVEKSVDPIRDMEIINTELILKDLETIDKIWKKAESEANSGEKTAKKYLESLRFVRAALEKGELLFAENHSDILRDVRIKELNLITAKPQIYLLNGNLNDIPPKLIERIKNLEADYVAVDLNQNLDLSELIKKSYAILHLISFLTTGEKETRAWTIIDGAKAPQAAGVIHSDFEKKFIRAETINWQQLLNVGGWSQAKQKGLLRSEGKEYIVQDGDVMEIRHGA